MPQIPANPHEAFVAGMMAAINGSPFRVPPPRNPQPAKPGQWRCRHRDRPDLFDETGAWRPGVDRFGL